MAAAVFLDLDLLNDCFPFFPAPSVLLFLPEIFALTRGVTLNRRASPASLALASVVSGWKETAVIFKVERHRGGCGLQRCRCSRAEPLLARHHFVPDASWGTSFDRLSQIILLLFAVKSFNP